MSLDWRDDVQLEYGFERDRLYAGAGVVRWWVYVFVPGAEGRPQGPRKGVLDRGFKFARGGRVATNAEAEDALREAFAEGRAEIHFWRGQPSHALGPNGELIPLDALLPELPS
jgi:hypothetical protein